MVEISAENLIVEVRNQAKETPTMSKHKQEEAGTPLYQFTTNCGGQRIPVMGIAGMSYAGVI